MTDYLQVVTTTDSQATAQDVARHLVEQRLAACVQVVGPIQSCYRWQGEITTDREWLCLVKTRADLYPRVEEAIRSLHSYEVPEILASPIVAGHAPYLAWLEDSVL